MVTTYFSFKEFKSPSKLFCVLSGSLFWHPTPVCLQIQRQSSANLPRPQFQFPVSTTFNGVYTRLPHLLRCTYTLAWHHNIRICAKQIRTNFVVGSRSQPVFPKAIANNWTFWVEVANFQLEFHCPLPYGASLFMTFACSKGSLVKFSARTHCHYFKEQVTCTADEVQLKPSQQSASLCMNLQIAPKETSSRRNSHILKPEK
jgi:hypothetical protein